MTEQCCIASCVAMGDLAVAAQQFCCSKVAVCMTVTQLLDGYDSCATQVYAYAACDLEANVHHTDHDLAAGGS